MIEAERDAKENDQRAELARLRFELKATKERLAETEHSDAVVFAMVDAGIISKNKEGNYDLLRRD